MIGMCGALDALEFLLVLEQLFVPLRFVFITKVALRFTDVLRS